METLSSIIWCSYIWIISSLLWAFIGLQSSSQPLQIISEKIKSPCSIISLSPLSLPHSPSLSSALSLALLLPSFSCLLLPIFLRWERECVCVSLPLNLQFPCLSLLSAEVTVGCLYLEIHHFLISVVYASMEVGAVKAGALPNGTSLWSATTCSTTFQALTCPATHGQFMWNDSWAPGLLLNTTVSQTQGSLPWWQACLGRPSQCGSHLCRLLALISLLCMEVSVLEQWF